MKFSKIFPIYIENWYYFKKFIYKAHQKPENPPTRNLKNSQMNLFRWNSMIFQMINF